jgi:hypothetical protein
MWYGTWRYYHLLSNPASQARSTFSTPFCSPGSCRSCTRPSFEHISLWQRSSPLFNTSRPKNTGSSTGLLANGPTGSCPVESEVPCLSVSQRQFLNFSSFPPHFKNYRPMLTSQGDEVQIQQSKILTRDVSVFHPFLVFHLVLANFW